MSLIYGSKKETIKPFIVFGGILALVLLITWLVYQHWNTWLLQSVVWQKQLNQGLSTLLQETAEDPWYAGGLLVAFSFLYGLLHALGPGHGKLIITTYIATQAAHLKQSVVISLLASLLQGIVAVVLVSSILIAFQMSTKHLNLASQYAEQLSYAFVVILGVILCFIALRQGWRLNRKAQSTYLKIHQISPFNKPQTAIKKPRVTQQTYQCECGHKHVIQEDELKQDIKTKALIILSMGLRPCSGALLILLFSYVVDVYIWGIVAAFAMAVGTAVTICGIAIFVHFMRYSALKVSQSKGIHLNPYWRVGIKFIAGIVFILMGMLMYQSLMIGSMGSPLLSPRL